MRSALVLSLFAASLGWSGSACAEEAGLIGVDGPGLLARVQKLDRKLVVVNVWATWCQPCVEEMPDFVRLAKEQRGRGVEVVFVTADFPSEHAAAVKMLKTMGALLPSLAQAGKEHAFIEALDPRWSGALPVTFIYARGGRHLRTIKGKVHYEELVRILGELEDK